MKIYEIAQVIPRNLHESLKIFQAFGHGGPASFCCACDSRYPLTGTPRSPAPLLQANGKTWENRLATHKDLSILKWRVCDGIANESPAHAPLSDTAWLHNASDFPPTKQNMDAL